MIAGRGDRASARSSRRGTAPTPPTRRGAALAVDATFEWIPYIKAIRVRLTIGPDGGPLGRHADAYLLRAADASSIRVLVVCESGAVYEGMARAIDDTTLEATLKGHGGEHVVEWRVRVSRDGAGSVRARLASERGDFEVSLVHMERP